MNKENCSLKLVDEIILYYDARSKKHQYVEVFTSDYSHHVMNEGHSDLLMSIAE